MQADIMSKPFGRSAAMSQEFGRNPVNWQSIFWIGRTSTRGACLFHFRVAFSRPELRFRPWNGPQPELRPTTLQRKASGSGMRPVRRGIAPELRKIGGVDAWMNEITAETSSSLRSREGTRHQSVLDESSAINVCELVMPARGWPIFQSSILPTPAV